MKLEDTSQYKKWESMITRARKFDLKSRYNQLNALLKNRKVADLHGDFDPVIIRSVILEDIKVRSKIVLMRGKALRVYQGVNTANESLINYMYDERWTSTRTIKERDCECNNEVRAGLEICSRWNVLVNYCNSLIADIDKVSVNLRLLCSYREEDVDDDMRAVASEKLGKKDDKVVRNGLGEVIEPIKSTEDIPFLAKKSEEKDEEFEPV